MSTASNREDSARYLSLVDSAAEEGRGVPSSQLTLAKQAWTIGRPPLLRVCAGEPMLLSDGDVDLIALVNRSETIGAWLLDENVDPDEYRLPEVLMEYLCHRYGEQRRGNGDRIRNLESIYRRYLLPFLIELDAALPEERRGVAAKRVRQLEMLPKILAGDAPLPAATVAGDHLNRRAVACVFLNLADAAHVVEGGARALQVALADEIFSTYVDVRTGLDIVRTSDLRAAGLLRELIAPHGIATSTATNVLRDLKEAIKRAGVHGAVIRGTFDLIPTEPLHGRRQRAPRTPVGHVRLADVAVTVPHLPPVGQVVLWLERLTGDRISESYGPQVCDFWRDPTGQAWLRTDKQGGISSLGRNPETGQFEQQDSKPHTKTRAGTRTIPLPEQLAVLLELLVDVFHTDAETGEIDTEARLIPGVQSENTSGQSTFRTWLGKAQKIAETSFHPHALRAALITDLKDAGIAERLAYHYAGHELPDAGIQDKHYDNGPSPQLLLPIARLLEQRTRDEVGHDVLHVPTAAREHWGVATRRHRQQDWIEQQLIVRGWRLQAVDAAGRGRLLTTKEVASRINKHPSKARALMASGGIVAETQRWGSREVWVAYEIDVDRYRTSQAGTSLNDLAAELDMEYHPLWTLARELQLLGAAHHRGAKIVLAADVVKRLRAEAVRRNGIGARAMTIAEAAETLQMAAGAVETLIRQKRLEIVDGPTRARRRYVSRTSVDAYNAAHPVLSPDVAIGCEYLLTCTQTARLTGLTRPRVTTLITTRQFRTGSKAGSRHVYITASSVVAWAVRTSQPAVAAAVSALVNAESVATVH